MENVASFANAPVGEGASLADKVRAFCTATVVENKAAKVRKDFREELLEAVRLEGKVTKKGKSEALVIDLGDCKLTRTTRQGDPDASAVEALLGPKGISLEDVSEKVTVVKLSATKLEALVENGTITQAEFDGLLKVSEVLSGELVK